MLASFTYAQQPPNCAVGGFVISPDDTIWVCRGTNQPAVQMPTGGSAAWGAITGTLSNQTDLQTALDGKQAAGSYATGTGTANGTNTGDQTTITGNAGSATVLQNARTINGVSFNGSANITVTADANTLSGTTLASGVTTSSLTTLGAAATLTTTGTIGYRTGAGGTVTQLTSKATAVTLSKACGAITLNAAALAAAAIVSFTQTNTVAAAGDVIVANHTATGTFGAYGINARSGAGSITWSIRNNTAGSLSEAIVLSFCVIKGATS
jgi:hypothetical protein